MVIREFEYEEHGKQLEKCIEYILVLMEEFYWDNPALEIPKEAKRILLKWVSFCSKNDLIPEHMNNCALVYGINFITRGDYLRFIYTLVYGSPGFNIFVDKLREGGHGK